MASSIKDDKKTSSSASDSRLALRPLTKDNIISYYTPLLGTASYTFLSVNVLNPSLAVTWFPKRDLTNALLFNSLLGTGCYIYSRAHLQDQSTNSRIGYAAFGSIVFSFSSVLLWAVLRSVLPQNVAVCSAAGVVSSYVLIKSGRSYLQLVDSRCGRTAK